MKHTILSIYFVCFVFYTYAQEQTVGVFVNEKESLEAYTLFSPLASNTTYLIDNCGYLIKSWEHQHNPAFSTLLLENGNLLRAGKPVDPNDSNNLAGGYLEIISWDNEVLWRYMFNSTVLLQHHDLIQMGNGNILMLAWERNTPLEQVEIGRDTNNIMLPFLWTEVVYEVKPIGTDSLEFVWEWHSKDHLIQDMNEQADNYGIIAADIGKIDINYVGPSSWAGPDWWHVNAIDYSPSLDQVMINARNNNEVWVIDHSTTTEEAATSNGGLSGRGGDLLFRWGNPEAYGRGSVDDLKMFGSHGTYWIPQGLPNSGKIMYFNNGLDRPDGEYSTIEIIAPSIDDNGEYLVDENFHFFPNESELVYRAPNPDDFFSAYLSNAQQLSNGNVLINEGTSGHIFEVSPAGDIVWDYVNPVGISDVAAQFAQPFRNSIFRAYKYEIDFPAFQGRSLIPKEELEGHTDISVCDAVSVGIASIHGDWETYYDAFTQSIVIEQDLSSSGSVEIYDLLGVKLLSKPVSGAGQQAFAIPNLSSGIYWVRINDESVYYKAKSVFIP